MTKSDDGKEKKISELAAEILCVSRDDILIHLRFFDMAVMKLKATERKGILCVAADGTNLYYDPVFILDAYKNNPGLVTRTYLHSLLHCVFSHNFQYDKLDADLWDMASDIAVENVILELGLSGTMLDTDDDELRKLAVLKEDAGAITAERIYRLFKNSPPTERERADFIRLFKRDEHALWKPKEEIEVSMEQWRKISERIKADLKSFTKAKSGTDVLEKNLEETTRERYDYSEILKRFTVMGEDIRVNDDEFDYIYYTYGLKHYGDMPLIEPLEYKETTKVREFVIAIDTSASCRGAIVRAFLQKTYSMLKSSENFFHKVNVHIIQCDSEVQSDTKITCDDDFDRFVKYGKLNGFGATDFRPVFEYVDKLKNNGEFDNLKGLIYFTDGYGIYPERPPGYDVIFAFLDEDENRQPVPPWSLKVVLESEGLIGDEH